MMVFTGNVYIVCSWQIDVDWWVFNNCCMARWATNSGRVFLVVCIGWLCAYMQKSIWTRYKKIGLCAQNTFLDYSTYLPFYTSYTSSVKLIALVLYSCATSSFDEDVIPLPRYCWTDSWRAEMSHLGQLSTVHCNCTYTYKSWALMMHSHKHTHE